jgi:hypothetical protein
LTQFEWNKKYRRIAKIPDIVMSSGLHESFYQEQVPEGWTVVPGYYSIKPTLEEYTEHYIPCDVIASSADLIVPSWVLEAKSLLQ